MNAFLRLLYSILIAASVVTFVSVAIWAFYPGPERPEYPDFYGYGSPSQVESGEAINQRDEAQAQYDQEMKAFDELNKKHARNSAIIALFGVVAFFAAGWKMLGRSGVVGEGLALGAIFTTIYGITMAGTGEFRPLLFLHVTAFLLGAVLLGYKLFNDKDQKA